MSWLLWAVGALQLTAVLVLVVRLAPGYRRTPPVSPQPEGLVGPTVTVLVPTLNEGTRIRPCLDGLARQGQPLTEIIVVDSNSSDDTPQVVAAAATRDPRVRLERDPPLPTGWIGKVWALQHGLSLATGEWVLGVDADTEPEAGMVAGVVTAAERYGFDIVSFSPLFDGQTAGERWLQPSMLVNVVYRVGAPNPVAPASRVMANGQCFLARRSVLQSHDGYAAAKQSFADDVAVARAYASRGARVGFLDGRRLYRVRSYRNAWHMWREWGRSFDLTDATGTARRWVDAAVTVVAQGLPIPVLLALAVVSPQSAAAHRLVLWASATLLAIRCLMTVAVAPSYARRGFAFWLSPLSDPVAALRFVLSTLRRPRQWRGRVYDLTA